MNGLTCITIYKTYPIQVGRCNEENKKLKLATHCDTHS
jgi:hypothetical protein